MRSSIHVVCHRHTSVNCLNKKPPVRIYQTFPVLFEKSTNTSFWCRSNTYVYEEMEGGRGNGWAMGGGKEREGEEERQGGKWVGTGDEEGVVREWQLVSTHRLKGCW